MRILIPILAFTRSGGGRVLSELATRWIARGHGVDFLVNVASPEPYFPTGARVIRVTARGRLEEAGPPDGEARMSAWGNLAGLYRGLAAIGRRYDVIFANHSLTAWPVALARCGGAAKFYYVQAYEPEVLAQEGGMKSRMLAALSAASYRLDLAQICNAPLYVGYRGIRARAWVPPGIDFDIFYPPAGPRRFAGGGRVILGCIGRREPSKGTKYVLEAFSALWDEDRRYELRVAFGNLPEGWSHPGVRIVEPRGDRELAEFYRSLDVMLAPGTVQLGAAHYPVMEAMACGTPVVTTGYIPADETNAWIVPVADAAAVATAVKTVAASPAIRAAKSEKGLQDIAVFGWEEVAERFLVLFREGAQLRAPAE